MRNIFFLSLLLLSMNNLQAAEFSPQSDWCDYDWNTSESVPPRLNLPVWACEVVTKNKLNQKYSPLVDINPFFITGDFEGDHQTDIAIRIKNNQTGDVGLAIIHFRSKHIFIIAAGQESGRGKDLRWFDMWSILPKGTIGNSSFESQSLTLKGDALVLIKSESASAILYWDGKKYAWYQTSD